MECDRVQAMGSVIPEIDGQLHDWIGRQRLFFVGTAPSGDGGRVNISPKGSMDTFVVLGPLEVAYVDLFGSGIETVAHLKQNGRIVLMLCEFEGPPKIIRLHGHGEVIEQGESGFSDLLARFDMDGKWRDSVRSIVRVDIERIADSCGFVVPRMSYAGERDQLVKFTDRAIRRGGPDAIREYCDVNNRESIDGLTALEPLAGAVSEDQRAAHAHQGRKL